MSEHKASARKPTTPECRYYNQKSGCKNDKNCKYKHVRRCYECGMKTSRVSNALCNGHFKQKVNFDKKHNDGREKKFPWSQRHLLKDAKNLILDSKDQATMEYNYGTGVEDMLTACKKSYGEECTKAGKEVDEYELVRRVALAWLDLLKEMKESRREAHPREAVEVDEDPVE